MTPSHRRFFALLTLLAVGAVAAPAARAQEPPRIATRSGSAILGALEAALGSLGMEPGDVATIHLFDPLAGKVTPYCLEAVEAETVETPAGSFETVRYELTDPDGQTGTRVWVGDGGRAVKMIENLPAQMGGGTATAELASGD